MNSFLKYFASRHLLATLITISVILIGLHRLTTIKRDLFPKVELNQVMITTWYPGASPADVEFSVTNKIEAELGSLTGIKKYTSYSLEDLSLITVDIEPDLSKKRVNETIQEIRNAVARLRGLPKQVLEAPTVTHIKTSEIPILEVGISSQTLQYGELRKYAKILERKLKGTKGVARVEKTGYRAREVKVELQPEKLAHYQISLRDVIMAIQARNARMTAGVLEGRTSEKNILADMQFKTPAEVGEVIVRSSFEGPVIRVKDLGIIRDDFERERTYSRINGKSAISFTIYKQEKADIIRTIDGIRANIQKETRFFPEDIEILYANDYSRYVKASYEVVKKNALFGMALVLVILALFLNLQSAFWVALGIPVSILGTIALLPFFGVALDVITLSAMILVLGILVDDAIVVLENIYRKMEKGLSPLKAAVTGVQEVLPPIITAIFTTLLAFIPMFFIPGDTGKFIYPIPLVIVLTLLLSLMESTFALPAHIAHTRWRQKNSAGWFAGIERMFARIHKPLLKVRYLWVLLFVVGFGAAVYHAWFNMKIIVFPNEGAEEFAIYCELPAEWDLKRTSQKVHEIEEILNQLSDRELESYITRIGTLNDGTFLKNTATIQVTLTPFSTRNRTAEQIAQELRGKFKGLKDFKEIYIDLEESGPSAAQPIVLNVVSSDNEKRNQLAAELVRFMESMGTLQDIRRNDRSGKPQINVELDEAKMAKWGMNASDVVLHLRAALSGETATEVRLGEDDVKFKVVFPDDLRKSVHTLKTLLVPNAENRMVPLSEFARIVETPGVTDYRHLNGQRVVTVSAELIPGATTVQYATERILNHFRKITERMPGVQILSEGEAERTETTYSHLRRILLMAVLGIYFLMMIQFNSFTQPLLIMFAIPFGFIGVVAAFTLHHQPISFMGMLGFIGLCGVVVNDSILLVNHLNNLLKNEGAINLRELVAKGTSERLRAILLTTITTSAGLLPLAYGIGGDDPYNAPMALALGWGLLAATPLTLLLVPSLYLIREDFAGLFRKIKSAVMGKKPANEKMEPGGAAR